MHNDSEIAIIGVSMRIAGATNMDELWRLISSDGTAFNALSNIREMDIFDRFGRFEIATGCYLPRIDLFDHDFFRINPGEAERMDPEQRLVMECAAEAVFNAGYLLQDLRGQRIGIFHTIGESRYRDFFGDHNNFSIAAHMPGMVGTRVANFMDWRGPVIGIDTTCSSALVALYYACESIKRGDCDVAFVGGASLGVASKEASDVSPVLSKLGRCIPFDDHADGTLPGEGVIGVLIKRANVAIRDGNSIHAIIRGGAVNHGGGLIQNISAPSPLSQSEVITLAWKNSHMDPKRIRFVEAHGTGTILGDPIEHSGLVLAFEGCGEKEKMKCGISSIKGQIGHLGPLAGLAGLLRMILALQKRRLLPQQGFNKLNCHIREEASPVKIQRQPEDWDSEDPRAGGVSSFGLTGTNVHMILEEYQELDDLPQRPGRGTNYLMKIGGATEFAAKNVQEYLKVYLSAHPNVPLSRLCHSVNKLLCELRYGELVLFKDRQDLEGILAGSHFSGRSRKIKAAKLYLLIPEILSADHLGSFFSQSRPLSEKYRRLIGELSTGIKIGQKARDLLLHYCATLVLMDGGIVPGMIIGAGAGKILSLLLTGEMSLPAAMEQAELPGGEDGSFNKEGFIQFLNSTGREENCLRLVMGTRGPMVDAIRNWVTGNEESRTGTIFPKNATTVCHEIIMGVYNTGSEVQLSSIFGADRFLRDLSLPLLHAKRCWPVVRPLVSSSGPMEQQAPADIPSVSYMPDEIVNGIKSIWEEKLRIGVVTEQDDFFDLGGSSLMGLDVLQSIAKKFKVELEYPDIFDYSTVAAQSQLVIDKLQKMKPEPTTARDEQKIDVQHREPVYKQLIQEVKNEREIFRLDPAHILLTGGTGFLGAHIIKELLDRTEARISCLIRSATDAAARDRLFETLQFYFPGEKLDYHRVIGLKGDITVEGLDLSVYGREALKNIDAVYHLAANVSHFAKEELVSKVNLGGSAALLEWARKMGIRTFNHFSTLAIAEGGVIHGVGKAVFFETDLDIGQTFYRSVYPASKMEAERYIRANKGDLQVNVIRTGNVGCDSRTGVFQKNIESNLFFQAVKALSSLSYYCDEIADLAFETTPVDMISRTAVELSLRPSRTLDTFHIYETKPIKLRQIVQRLENYDILLKKTSWNDFYNYLNGLFRDSTSFENNWVLGVLKFDKADRERTVFTIRREATDAWLEKLAVSYAYDKEEYIDTILSHFIKIDA